jgi:hypothetical protein
MDLQESKQELGKKEILFPNGNRAQMVLAPAGTPASTVLKALEIQPPKALILLSGGAADLAEALKPRLFQLFSRGIARVAVDSGALIMDGGTQAGVMEIIGQGVADRGRKSPLLGITPAGKVTYPGGPAPGSIEDGAALDPNHSHFALADCTEWGAETDLMYELADSLGKRIPVVTVLVDGGPISKGEILRSVRRGWPILVVEGSGRLADEIARLHKEKPSFIADPITAEIMNEGNILLYSLEGSIEELERNLLHLLNIDKTLKLAWERFALYDENSKRQQAAFQMFQRLVLILGVSATLYALAQTQMKGNRLLPEEWWGFNVLHYAIIILPIMISILVAVINRFKAGNKWILLRSGAEAIKREIYRYRGRAEIYKNPQPPQNTPEAELARRMEDTSRRLMQTDVNLSALYPYSGPIPPQMYGAAAEDDGFSFLTPDRYLAVRLGDQLSYYRSKTKKLDKQLKLLHWLIYIFGGLGTLLAAAGLELWVALTTSLVGTFTTFLEYQQVENTLMKYNQAATDLANIETWWTSLTAEEKGDQKNIDQLVGLTEKILESELTGWVQQMENALAKLRAEQMKKDQTEPRITRPAQEPVKE